MEHLLQILILLLKTTRSSAGALSNHLLLVLYITEAYLRVRRVVLDDENGNRK